MNSNTLKAAILTTIFCAIILSSCDETNPYEIDFSSVPEPFSIDTVTKNETESGLIYYIIEEGEGIYETEPRDQVRIYYTKRLKRDLDEIISSSYANGVFSPVSANINNSQIVAEDGFREGLLGMKEGEKRVLILPPSLAYQNAPSSPYSEDSLWIDVELSEIVL